MKIDAIGTVNNVNAVSEYILFSKVCKKAVECGVEKNKTIDLFSKMTVRQLNKLLNNEKLFRQYV